MFNIFRKNDDYKRNIEELTKKIEELEKKPSTVKEKTIAVKEKTVMGRPKLTVKKLVKDKKFTKDQYTVKEFAKVCGAGRSSIQKMISDHRLKGKKINGKWIIKTEDLPLSKKQKEGKAGRPRVNSENSYKLTIMINDELEDYMKKQPYITMESRKNYINRLIKEDFERRIGVEPSDTKRTVKKKWTDYIENRLHPKKTNEDYKDDYWKAINEAINISNDIFDFSMKMYSHKDIKFGVNALDNLIKWGKLNKFGSKEILLRNEETISFYGVYASQCKDIRNITKPVLE